MARPRPVEMGSLYGPSVRIRSAFAPRASTLLLVEVKDVASSTSWRTLAAFDIKRDPLAFENAEKRAIAARRSLIEMEEPETNR